jgi:hypothetical protein
MEIDELKKIWQQYDLKLNNLEKINKKLILETLSKKPKKKLSWIQGKIIYAIIVTPLVFIIVIPKFFTIGNIDWQMIVGGILSISVLIILMYFYFKGFIALIGIKVNQDSIVESVRKVIQYKSIINTRQKYLWISYPILLAGIILIERKTLNFDTEGLLFMTAILIFIFAIGYVRFRYQQNEIKDLEKDMTELQDYLQ